MYVRQSKSQYVTEYHIQKGAGIVEISVHKRTNR